MNVIAAFLKFLKGQGDIICVGEMPFFFSDGDCRPTHFPCLGGFNPSYVPATGLQIFENGFPLFLHARTESGFNSGIQLENLGHRGDLRRPRYSQRQLSAIAEAV